MKRRRTDMNVATMELACVNCVFRLAGSRFLGGFEDVEADRLSVEGRRADAGVFGRDVNAERQIEEIERSFGRDWKW
jgi:hypothetical protein